jgi:hypothetical protein
MVKKRTKKKNNVKRQKNHKKTKTNKQTNKQAEDKSYVTYQLLLRFHISTYHETSDKWQMQKHTYSYIISSVPADNHIDSIILAEPCSTRKNSTDVLHIGSSS